MVQPQRRIYRNDVSAELGWAGTKEETRHQRQVSSAVRGGFEPPVRKPVRQFSKLLV